MATSLSNTASTESCLKETDISEGSSESKIFRETPSANHGAEVEISSIDKTESSFSHGSESDTGSTFIESGNVRNVRCRSISSCGESNPSNASHQQKPALDGDDDEINR